MRGFYAILDATPEQLDAGDAPARSRRARARCSRRAPCCLQLRAKSATARALEAAARRLLPLCRAAGVPFCVNDRLDVALAVGADVVHLGQDDLPLADARRVRAAAGRPDLVIGFSTHNRAQAVAAAAGGRRLHRLRPGVRHAQQAEPRSDGGAGGARGGLPRGRRSRSSRSAASRSTPCRRVARAGASAAAIIAAIEAAPDPTAAGRAVGAAFAGRDNMRRCVAAVSTLAWTPCSPWTGRLAASSRSISAVQHRRERRDGRVF